MPPDRLLDRALDVLLPRRCAGCGLPGGDCCAACMAGLTAQGPPLCDRCGCPQPLRVPRCPQCRAALEATRQAVAYAGPAPALVRALKDDRRRSLAGVMAGVMVARCPPPPAGASLVPVPLGRARGRARGFNQSALIAHALGAAWAVPVAEGALMRVREEPPQRGASRSARARQASGAFAVPRGAAPPGVCWLVDDVLTTGATLAACAAALRRGGARRVGAVAFARVVPRASVGALPVAGARQ